MYPVSEAFLRAVESNTRKYYWTGTITTKAHQVYNFGPKDIVRGSGYISSQCCGSSEIELGGVYSAELGITLYSDIDRYTLEGAEIEISFFLKVDGEKYEEVPMGIYEISEANRTLSCIAIKAYDRMLRFDKDFKNTVSSGTAYELLSLACEQCGVELSHTEEEITGWKNGSTVLGIYTENDIETWRDLLYYTAQVLGRFCTISREGKLELRAFGDSPSVNIPDTQRFSSSFSDFVTRYTAISSTNSRTQTAEYYALEPDDGLTMNLGINPLLQFGLEETRKELLLNILDDIAKIRYVPFDSSTIGNPAFDLGDIITFSGGHADSGQISCITKYEFRINGKHTLGCVGKNPRLSRAKSKNDKNITGLLNSVEAGKIAVHTYMNASPYLIGSTDTEIASIEFASNEDTDAQFHGSILLDVSAEKVEKTASASGTIVLPDESGEMSEQEKKFSLSWSEDGQAVVRVTYIINDNKLTTYVPVETWHSGRHILNLYYPLSGLKADSYNTFRVWLKMSGGTAAVDRGQAVCTISGQGLSSNGTWDGRLEFSDDMTAVPNTGIMPVASYLASVKTHTETPKPYGFCDSFSSVGFAGIFPVGFAEDFALNPVTVTEIIEPSDKSEMQYDKYLLSTDEDFRLNTEYVFTAQEYPIDRGRMEKLTIDTSRFARVDSLEVETDG